MSSATPKKEDRWLVMVFVDPFPLSCCYGEKKPPPQWSQSPAKPTATRRTTSGVNPLLGRFFCWSMMILASTTSPCSSSEPVLLLLIIALRLASVFFFFFFHQGCWDLVLSLFRMLVLCVILTFLRSSHIGTMACHSYRKTNRTRNETLERNMKSSWACWV